MKYGDLVDVVQTLNTGAYNPDNLGLITKIVLGKIARKKLPSRIKLAEISTGGNTSLVLGSSSYLPDFLGIKTDNDNKFLYYYESADLPIYLTLKPYSRLVELQGNHCSIVGKTLYLSGDNTPDTIYFNYYSKYLVLDEDGTTEKETPENNYDEILLPSEFDDLLVDGILLYISRREKQDNEFTKNVQSWERAMSEVLFLA